MASGQRRASMNLPQRERYPIRLEYELRKRLLAGETRGAMLAARQFLAELSVACDRDIPRLKSGIVEATVVVYHKSFQVGIPVERSVAGLAQILHSIDACASIDELQELFLGVIDQLLETIRLQPSEAQFSFRVNSYVQAHFHKDMSLRELAQAMHMEPAQLRRAFAREMGVDFRYYLTQTRMRAAKNLLLNTSLTIAEIATMVGYREAAYFIRVFRRVAGLTPGQFTRREVCPGPGDSDRPVQEVASSSYAIWQSDGSTAEPESASTPYGSQLRSSDDLGRVLTTLQYPWQAEKDICNAVLSGDSRESRRAARTFLDVLSERITDVVALRSYVVKLAIVLARKCLQSGVPVDDVLSRALDFSLRVSQLPTLQEIHSALDELVLELSQRVAQQKHENIRAVETLKSFIRANYSRPIKLDELAALVNYSPGYLVRVFSKVAGATPYDYLINTRIDVAKQLVQSTRLTLEDISLAVGYHDTANFISAFKKRVGMTPKEYAQLRGSLPVNLAPPAIDKIDAALV